MNLHRSAVRDVTVITLDGHLDSGSAPDVQAGLEKLVAEQPRVLLNLGSLSYLSSAGLRVLLLVGRQARSTGGRLAMADAQPEVAEVLSATGFISFFMITDSVADGVKALAA